MALWREQAQFISKLNARRSERTELETRAATAIQRTYRGFARRSGWSAVKARLELRQRLRSKLWSSLTDGGWVVSAAQHKSTQAAQIEQSALRIQSAARTKYARSRVETRRDEVEQAKRDDSVVLIQNAARGRKARLVLNRENAWRAAEVRVWAAELIQKSTRRHLAGVRIQTRRAQLHRVAATMIQCFIRCRKARSRVRTKIVAAAGVAGGG